MATLPRATRRWLVAFLALACAGVGVLAWTLWSPSSAPQGTAAPGTAPTAPALPERPSGASASLRVAPLAGAQLTVSAASEPGTTSVSGAALLRPDTTTPDSYVLDLDPGDPVASLQLDPERRWLLDLGGGFARLALDVATLPLAALRLEQSVHSLEGSLPAAGRSQLAFGAGRSTLLAVRGSTLDARFVLGAGPLLLRVEPEVRGDLILVGGAGPTTIVVDAGTSVALRHASGESPALALEGTWWRHRSDDTVTWVRSPLAAQPSDAELLVTLSGRFNAPLAITYR